MDDVFITVPLDRKRVKLPSPFPATIKTPESRKPYNVEWHVHCDVQLQVAPDNAALPVGIVRAGGFKVPYIVFEGRLFRQVYGPEGKATLEQLLTVAPLRLLGGQGIHAEPWWRDHPLALHLDTATARAFSGMLRPPGANDWWKDARISTANLGNELKAKARGRAAADRLILLGSEEPYQQVDIPGWSIAVDANTSTVERWVGTVPIKPFHVYLPYWWRQSRMVRSWEPLLDASAHFLAARQAYASTLQAVALTIDWFTENPFSPGFVTLREILEVARAAVEDSHTNSINAALSELLRVMDDDFPLALRQYGREIGRHLPDFPR